MKRIFILFLLLHPLSFLHAATSPSLVAIWPSIAELPSNANYIFLPVGSSGQTISLMALSKISIGEFELLKGKKLNFFDRIGFKLGQRKLRNKIEVDGTIKNSRIAEYANKIADDDSGSNFGGFALGFGLNIWGILIAYLINDEKKRQRVKWAWIGFGTLAVLVSLFAIIYGGL
jgi:hypothetical protein